MNVDQAWEQYETPLVDQVYPNDDVTEEQVAGLKTAFKAGFLVAIKDAIDVLYEQGEFNPMRGPDQVYAVLMSPEEAEEWKAQRTPQLHMSPVRTEWPWERRKRGG